MPIYEYQCQECGERMEEMQGINDPPLEKCRSCSGALRKLISAPAFQFKGTGWYVTDYGKGGTSGSASSSSDSSESSSASSSDSSSSDSGSDSSSASKPAAKSDSKSKDSKSDSKSETATSSSREKSA